MTAKRFVALLIAALAVYVAWGFATTKPIEVIGEWNEPKPFEMGYPALIPRSADSSEVVGLSYKPGTESGGFDDPVVNYHQPDFPSPTFIKVSNSPDARVFITFRSAPTYRQYAFGFKKEIGLAREFVLHWNKDFYGSPTIVAR